MTAIKRAILNLLSENHCLTSKKQLIKHLTDQNLQPARSTLLRELNFLEKAGIIRKVSFARKDYYELNSEEHQHLICQYCHRITPVELNLKAVEQQIAPSNFRLNTNKIVLSGSCTLCQQKLKR